MYRGIYWGYLMGLFNEISSRAVSAGVTPANVKSREAVSNPFEARNKAAIWERRTFDDARLAKKEEMQKKALFSFEKTFTVDNAELPEDSTKQFIS